MSSASCGTEPVGTGGAASRSRTGAGRESRCDDAPNTGTARDNARSLDESATGVGGTNAGSQSLGWDADPALTSGDRRQETEKPRQKTASKEKNDVIGRSTRRREWTGEVGNGLMAVRPVPGVRTARPATRTSCDSRLSRSHTPPPLSPPGTRPRRLPRTRRPHQRDIPSGMSQPPRMAGIAGTQEHRDRPG